MSQVLVYRNRLRLKIERQRRKDKACLASTARPPSPQFQQQLNHGNENGNSDKNVSRKPATVNGYILSTTICVPNQICRMIIF